MKEQLTDETVEISRKGLLLTKVFALSLGVLLGLSALQKERKTTAYLATVLFALAGFLLWSKDYVCSISFGIGKREDFEDACDCGDDCDCGCGDKEADLFEESETV